MTVKDLMELYEDDPAGYFNNTQRKPESHLYEQHALAGLKDVFRFHSKVEIENIFQKCGRLYTPAFNQLKQMMKNGKNTRKTRRPDSEVQYPFDSCIEYLKEKKFTELEKKILIEKAMRIVDR